MDRPARSRPGDMARRPRRAVVRAPPAGGAIRHEYALTTYGTVGCLALGGGRTFLVSSDHVLRPAGVPSEASWLLLPGPVGEDAAPVARWVGRSLAGPRTRIADLAAAELLRGVAVERPGRLAVSGDATATLTGTVAPARDLAVLIVGARSGLMRGRVTRPRTRRRLFHPLFGERRFALQFELAVGLDGTPAPASGDSGAPVVTTAGELVGFLAALGLGSATNARPAACPLRAYAVPAREGLAGLGVRLWTHVDSTIELPPDVTADQTPDPTEEPS